jgi:glycosyltransferase involved in cell wall biosynthesis
MGDIGLLLREVSIINKVASPTKFPEYLASGVPVVVSRDVGNTTEVVEKTGLGVVVDVEAIEEQVEKVTDYIMSYRSNAEEIRKKCRETAEELFIFKDTEGLSRFYRSIMGEKSP